MEGIVALVDIDRLQYSVRVGRWSKKLVGEVAFELEMFGVPKGDEKVTYKMYWCPHCDGLINPAALEGDAGIACFNPKCGQLNKPDQLIGERVYLKSLKDMASVVAGFVRADGAGDVILLFDGGPTHQIFADAKGADSDLWKSQLQAGRKKMKHVVYPMDAFAKDCVRADEESALLGMFKACL